MAGEPSPATKRQSRKRRRRSRPKHLVALEHPYEFYIELNGGEHCGICGKTDPTTKADRKGRQRKRFDRDHDHKTGEPRGLLCVPCNMRLSDRMTPEWLRAAAAYMERGEPDEAF